MSFILVQFKHIYKPLAANSRVKFVQILPYLAFHQHMFHSDAQYVLINDKNRRRGTGRNRRRTGGSLGSFLLFFFFFFFVKIGLSKHEV